MEFNYQTVCHSNLLKDLPERQKDVLSRRFGLRGERQTLESIGRNYDITRERVRQIEEDGLRGLVEKLETPTCQNVFHYFVKNLESSGSLKREDLLLNQLGGEKFKNHVFFLLTLGKPFQRISETADLYAFWTIDKNSLNVARRNIDVFISILKKKKKALPLPSNVPTSHLEISKNILKGPEGLYGLPDWPEINPKGIKDKAYLVFKKEKKPLHFTEVARGIGKNALPQTVHNELIRDQRFVLVGRGLYALQEWGYRPGVVREVISGVLERAKRPLAKEEVLKKVLLQRQVKPNTILLNLQNKKYFIKNSQAKYFIRQA